MTILKKDSIASLPFLIAILCLLSYVGANTADSQNLHPSQSSYLSDYTTNPTVLLLEKYIRDYHTFSLTVYETLEKLIEPAYQEIRKNIWLNLVFSAGLALIGLRVILSFFKSLFKSKKNFSYNREESISLNDVQEHFKKFSGELDKMRKQIDEVSKSGIKTNPSKGETQVITTSAKVDADLKNEINQITQNLTKNEETINKFLKEKKHVDNFLLEFQKEVVESHKTIWKELYTLRNILTLGKSTTPNASTPLNKPRTHDRTMSTMQASLDIDRNSPNISSKSIDGLPKEFMKEYESSQSNRNSMSTFEKSTAQAANLEDISSKNKKPETINAKFAVPEKQVAVNREEVSDSADKNGEPTKEKLVESEAADANDTKREVSPFRIPPGNGIKQGGPIGRNIPIPQVRRPGPAIGSNPFNKQINTNPGANSSQV